MEDEVAFECSAALDEGGRLEIHYRVVNKGAAKLYLTAPLTRLNDKGIAEADPGRVYTFMDEEGVLQVTKRLWELPENILVYMPEVPRLSLLMPGAAFEETVWLPMPVEIEYPYQWPEGKPIRKEGGGLGAEEPEELKSNTAGIAFSIGYVTETDGRFGVEQGSGSTFGARYDDLIARQEFLQSEAMELSVMVREVISEEREDV